MTSLANQATSTTAPIHQNKVVFDTDSFEIGINDRASGCMSHVPEDFDLVPSFHVTNPSRDLEAQGHQKSWWEHWWWRWLDGDGEEHEFTMPKSHCSQHGDMRLLSPQHLAKALKDPTGTGKTTVGDVCTLFWNGRQNKLTVPLSKTDNVATLSIRSWIQSMWKSHCHECKVEQAGNNVAPTQVASDDEDDDSDEEVEVHRHNIDSDKPSPTSSTSTSTTGWWIHPSKWSIPNDDKPEDNPNDPNDPNEMAYKLDSNFDKWQWQWRSQHGQWTKNIWHQWW